jgi:GTP cyclohydrolase I
LKHDLIEKGVGYILAGLEVDPTDRNYNETPARVSRMFQEWFTNKQSKFKFYEEKHDEIILLRNYTDIAVCPHHLLPVELRVHVAYIPRTHVLGLSKLGRIVRGCLQGPILQEALTDMVADSLYTGVPECLGSACIIIAEHGCMQHRGIRTTGDIVTSAMRGAFRENPQAREELLSLCNM